MEPTLSILDFEQGFKIRDVHEADFHIEAKEQLNMVASNELEVPSSPVRQEAVHSAHPEITAKSKFWHFVEHNEKFLLSFLLNIVLLWMLYKSNYRLNLENSKEVFHPKG